VGFITSFKQRKTAVRGDSDSRSIEAVCLGRTLTQAGVSNLDSFQFDLFSAGKLSLGELTDIDVLNYASGTFATIHDGMLRSTIDIELIKDSEPEVYICTANYERDITTREEDTELPLKSFDFEYGAETERVIRSREPYKTAAQAGGGQITLFVDTSSGPPEPVPMDAHIGKSPDSDEIPGVEVAIPVLSFSVSYSLPPGFFLPGYLSDVLSVVGHVNDDPWSQFQPGEVLCVGIGGRANSEGNSELVFKFKAKRNRTNVFVSDGITVPFIEGWQYLWTYPKKKRQLGATDLGIAAASAYIATIYPRSTFGDVLEPLPFQLVSTDGSSFVTADGGQRIGIAG
jgi:hypothetical protein